MKLADFEKVGTLMKERDYLRNLTIQATDKTRSVRIGGLDLRPDLAEAVRPALVAAFAEEIDLVDRRLRALGVTVGEEPESA